MGDSMCLGWAASLSRGLLHFFLGILGRQGACSGFSCRRASGKGGCMRGCLKSFIPIYLFPLNKTFKVTFPDARHYHCRVFDHSNEGFKGWEFMTVHCWGERAAGEWTLEIHDTPSQVRNPTVQGKDSSLAPMSCSTHRSPLPPKLFKGFLAWL